MLLPSKTPLHRWRFFRAGGFDQVRLDTGADLLNLAQLDQKLWVALSCPTQGVEFDPRTLALIDADHDGHVRAPELIGAIDWAATRLKSADTLIQGGALKLADIDDSHDDGRKLLASARGILASLGKADATTLTVDDCADVARIYGGMAFNGDGVVTAVGQDETLTAAIGTIVAQLGGKPDRSGEAGIDRDALTRFFDEARALVAWRAEPGAKAELQPLGADTEAAHAALQAVRAKVDDFFMRCRLAAFDPRAGGLLNGSEDDLKRIGAQVLAGASDADVAALPLAYVQSGAALSLAGGLNPAWADAVAALRDQVVAPLLGARTELSEADWAQLKARFAPREAWLAAKPATALEAVDADALAALVAGDAHARLGALLDQDEAAAEQAALIADVERLVRFVRDLARLANNFVSFTDFYTRRDKASFQAGTLYIDGRSCDLCVKVLDPARHAALATLSGVYLVYVDCTRAGQKLSIAAAVTAGDSDQLMVGRNGVFYDREGRDWDATITKIVDHPISIRQAFWSPYKKVVRLIGEQAQKFAAAKAKAADDLATQSVIKAGDKVTTVPAAGPAPAQPPAAFDVAKFAGIFAALGLAVGAIGTALASVVTGFIGLKPWQMPLALLGLMLLISGPAMAMAYFKLRNRNLGPILDANGWAINTRARINIAFGTALTQTARLPEGADRALMDPYADKKSRWPWIVLAVLVLAWITAYVTAPEKVHQLLQPLGAPAASAPKA
ncbi:hypothetical protein DEH84_00090 [Aquabacterium olei]|uniref:EF-hand domain-containing protein n=1 Tax=Aquabacterium olei TaxID=1296669 RepID=A0A2U8FM49_9BURK|nr:hypothetical protein [Aquabacterium olei]AWI52023.1 hypothetical protein DEH84_00090 [Aquabacterium olei]